ncbi:hypothetical protein [Paraburkholderia sediminicola]|uniref:hypothetical protein n=1 Tax=Paraburkholderia sediminicola TaxID=458836 RepID=UPI0038BB052C
MPIGILPASPGAISGRRKRHIETALAKVDFNDPKAVDKARQEITQMGMFDKRIDRLFNSNAKKQALEAIATIGLCQQAREWERTSPEPVASCCHLTEVDRIVAQVKLTAQLSPQGWENMERSTVEVDGTTKVRFTFKVTGKSGSEDISWLPVLEFVHTAEWDKLTSTTQLGLYACVASFGALNSTTDRQTVLKAYADTLKSVKLHANETEYETIDEMNRLMAETLTIQQLDRAFRKDVLEQALDAIVTINQCQMCQRASRWNGVSPTSADSMEVNRVVAQVTLISLLSPEGWKDLKLSPVQNDKKNVSITLELQGQSGDQTDSLSLVFEFEPETEWDTLSLETQLSLYACRDAIAVLNSTKEAERDAVDKQAVTQVCRAVLWIICRNQDVTKLAQTETRQMLRKLGRVPVGRTIPGRHE